MAKPSGLLNGRGCYDSIRKCENDTSVFLSIRNHGTPFIVEQRQAMERSRAANAIDQNPIENKLKKQFMAGNSIVLKFVKCVFMVLFFPFHFFFSLLPRLVIEKILRPLFRVIKRILQFVIPPCVKVFLFIYRPVASLCKKIAKLCIKVFAILKPPLLACFRFLSRGMRFFKPLFSIIPSQQSSGQTFFQKIVYCLKVSYIWFKLLIGFGFIQARDQVRDTKSSKSKNKA